MENEVAAAKADTTHVLKAINEAKKSILGKKAFSPDSLDLSKIKSSDEDVKDLAKNVKLNEAELVQAEQLATNLGADEDEDDISEAAKDEQKKSEQKKIA